MSNQSPSEKEDVLVTLPYISGLICFFFFFPLGSYKVHHSHRPPCALNPTLSERLQVKQTNNYPPHWYTDRGLEIDFNQLNIVSTTLSEKIKNKNTKSTKWLVLILGHCLIDKIPVFMSFTLHLLPPSLLRLLLGGFSLVLRWPYKGPFSWAGLFSADLNSEASELPNKAHIGNSMSSAGFVVYCKMITGRQRGWAGLEV